MGGTVISSLSVRTMPSTASRFRVGGKTFGLASMTGCASTTTMSILEAVVSLSEMHDAADSQK